MSETVTVSKTLSGDAYHIILDPHFSSLTETVRSLDPDAGKRRILLTADTNTGPLYLEEAVTALRPVFSEVRTLVIPAGENHKNLDTVRDVLRMLIEYRFDRHDYLAALGGGVVGDLVGFVSSVYLRGTRFLQIPTTLLSQTDSSIGGKTGVDLDGFKNMVGAFHQPSLVYISLSVLNTLPDREYSGGMAEILKHGLIRDAAYYSWLIRHSGEIMAREPGILMEMIRRSLLIKAAVVEADPKEEGLRAILNFGHTIGHAIERAMDFRLLHGECVALGSIAAAYLSCRRGCLRKELFDSIRKNYPLFGLPVSLPEGIDAGSIVRNTRLDKKMDRGQVRFVLLNGIGNAFTDTSITEKEMLEAVQVLREQDTAAGGTL